MNESVAVFGTAARLVGIATLGADPAQRAAIVLANSGVVHRIGANRISVTLARRLAAAGFDSLRFDMSSLGESTGRADLVQWEESAAMELSEGIDVVTTTDSGRPVVLYGNCGGAAKSVWTALRDRRVRGLALTNPPPHPAESEPTSDERVSTAATDAVARDLDTLFARGVRAKFVYAVGDPGLDYFERRLEPRLRRWLDEGRLEIATVPHSNHTFSPVDAQRTAIDALAAWIAAHYGDGTDAL